MTPKLTSKISIAINVTLTGLKLLFGFSIGSMTIIADGINSALDIVSSIMIFLGIREAGKPADSSHPYGHEKFESLAAFSVVILIGITAFLIISEAIQSLVSKEALKEVPPEAFYLFTGVFLVNIAASKLKIKVGKAHDSKGLVTDGKHSEFDALISIGVLTGLFMINHYPLLDGVTAILISLYIFYSGFQLYKKTSPSLVDEACPETEKKIKRELREKGLFPIEIKTRKTGRKCIAEATVNFNPRKKIGVISSIRKDLENELPKEIQKLKEISITVRSEVRKVEN